MFSKSNSLPSVSRTEYNFSWLYFLLHIPWPFIPYAYLIPLNILLLHSVASWQTKKIVVSLAIIAFKIYWLLYIPRALSLRISTYCLTLDREDERTTVLRNVGNHATTRCNIPEDFNLEPYRRKNFKSRMCLHMCACVFQTDHFP
jgi:hypothetical protein